MLAYITSQEEVERGFEAGITTSGFARVRKLNGIHLEQASRNVVDADIRGSFDIFPDSMARVRYNREHQVEPEAVKILELHEVDCEIEEDEEIETVSEAREILVPGMSKEITGIDDKVTKIEEWQVSCLD
jgi:hypothetical protein